LSELSRDWWWEQDARHRFISVSKIVASHGGVTREDHLGRTRWELPNTEPVNTTWAAHRALLRARRPFRDLLLRRIDRSDGSEHYILVSGKPLFASDGRFKGYRGIASDVTERIVTERALRESEQYFRATFEQAAVGVVHNDLDGRFVRVNQKFADLLGYQAHELAGKSIRELSHPDDAGMHNREIAEVIAGERRSFTGERRLLRRDGSVIWVNRTASLAREESGNRYLIQVIEDITARKREERLREETESRLRATFEQAAVGMTHVGLDNRYLQVNGKFCEMVGYDAGELVGRPATIVSHPEDVGVAGELRERLLAGEIASFTQEKRYRRKDGGTIWVKRTESLARDGGGQPLYFIRVIEDITRSKTLERQFQVIFEQAAVGIVRTDFERNILEVNGRFCEMIGYGREELLRMNLQQISHPQDLAMDSVDRGRLIAGEIQHFSREKRYVCRDGRVIWARRTVSLARDMLGNPEHFIFVIEDVTARRQTEEIYRATFESAPVGIMHTAPDRRILHVNSKLCEILGYTREELLSMSLDSVVRKEVLGSDQPHFMRPMLEGRMQSFSSERPYVRKDGSTVWVNRTVSLVRDADGHPLYFIRIVQDVTERRRAEEAAARERALLRAVVDALPERIYVKDRDGRFLLQNAANLAVRGIVNHDDIVGKTVHDIFPPDLAERLEAEDRAVMESGEPLLSREGRTFFGDAGRRGGSVRWHLTSKVPLKDAEGRVYGLVGVNRDITDRKRIEEELRESEETFRVTFSQANVGIALLSPEFDYLQANDNYCATLGYAREELIGKNIQDVNYPEDAAHSMRLRERVLAGELRTITLEKQLLRKDGSPVWVNLATSLVRTADGAPKHFITVMQDISERKEAERAMRENEELYRNLFERAPVPLLVMEESTLRLLAVNEAALEKYGYDRDEFTRMSILDLQVEEDRARVERELRARDPARSAFFLRRHVTKSGERLSVEVTGRPFVYQGRQSRMLLLNDVTERRRAEQALLESEERFRATFEQAGVGMALRGVDPENPRWLRVNQKLCDILGYTREELLRLTSVELTPPEERRAAIGFNEQLVRGEVTSYSREKRYLRKDGSAIWVNVSLSAVRDADGRPTHVISVIQDISERKRVEAALRESEEQFRQLAGNIPQVFWISDVALRQTIYLSPASEAMIGRPLHELLADRRALVRCVHVEDRRRVAAARRRAARGGYDQTFRVVRPDGSTRWVHDRAFPVRNAAGEIYRIAGIAEDITARRQAEQALRESEEQFRQLAGNIPQVFWITDVAQKELIYVSPAYERVTGRSIATLQADPRSWLDAVHAEDRERVRKARAAALRGNYDEIFRVVRPDGAVRWVRDRAFPVRDAEGRVHRIAGIGEDITDRRDAEERLMYLAHYDALTSLPNRVLFYDRLKQALAQARRNDWITAVMFFDLDRFKNVNDTLGHSAGDELLKRVSERVMTCVRSGDTVGRLGGDEFAIVLSNLSGPRDATLVAHKIMAALSEPFVLEGSEVFVTASIGITLFPTDSEDQDTLIRNADTAMYRAKELGRNGCQFYTPEMNARALEKLSLETSLRRALERREFLLHYQPKASLAGGEITGVEALLRWRHPELGLIPPADFMPMLEETGLVVAAGEWVLRTACAQIRRWQAAGVKAVPIAINLSARQFQAKDLGQSIARILEEEGVAHDLLELEITESSLVGNADDAANTLAFLNSLGIRVAIDDFGTGYSSLSYLKRFPLDSLKIDGSFVRDVTTDADDAAITRAIITMAHSLELSVVAEGVETAQQLAFLHANGCDEIQGYYFTRPLPAEEVTELLRSGRRLQRPQLEGADEQACVLLVDDDADALTLLERELEQDGYRIYTAGSAREGLEILARHPVRVVVSDYSMPGMSGVEFLQKVKSLYPDTVRIMLSGHTDFHTVTEAVNKGEIYRFVAKNWDSAHLRSNIRQALLAVTRAERPGAGRASRAV
jgi:diguanylate cyclase (GGDEF)-like protein/PAS domain S-box-containing protein